MECVCSSLFNTASTSSCIPKDYRVGLQQKNLLTCLNFEQVSIVTKSHDRYANFHQQAKIVLIDSIKGRGKQRGEYMIPVSTGSFLYYCKRTVSNKRPGT